MCQSHGIEKTIKNINGIQMFQKFQNFCVDNTTVVLRYTDCILLTLLTIKIILSFYIITAGSSFSDEHLYEEYDTTKNVLASGIKINSIVRTTRYK